MAGEANFSFLVALSFVFIFIFFTRKQTKRYDIDSVDVLEHGINTSDERVRKYTCAVVRFILNQLISYLIVTMRSEFNGRFPFRLPEQHPIPKPTTKHKKISNKLQRSFQRQRPKLSALCQLERALKAFEISNHLALIDRSDLSIEPR